MLGLKKESGPGLDSGEEGDALNRDRKYFKYYEE